MNAFGSRPDLLVVDGGKPQLTAAINQLNELGLDIPVCGLAKSDEEVLYLGRHANRVTYRGGFSVPYQASS